DGTLAADRAYPRPTRPGNLSRFARVQAIMSLRKAAAAAAVWAALAASGCDRNQAAGPPPTMPPMPVALTTARVTPIEDATDYVATVKSLHSTTIQPQIDGQITQILVKSGD